MGRSAAVSRSEEIGRRAEVDTQRAAFRVKEGEEFEFVFVHICRKEDRKSEPENA